MAKSEAVGWVDVSVKLDVTGHDADSTREMAAAVLEPLAHTLWARAGSKVNRTDLGVDGMGNARFTVRMPRYGESE